MSQFLKVFENKNQIFGLTLAQISSLLPLAFLIYGYSFNCFFPETKDKRSCVRKPWNFKVETVNMKFFPNKIIVQLTKLKLDLYKYM